MQNKYLFANLVMLVILVLTVGILGYLLGAKATTQEGLISDTFIYPTPDLSVSPSIGPVVTLTPITTPTGGSTPTPTIAITATPVLSVSGISGLVVLDGNSISSVEVRISDSKNNLIRTVITGTDGRFRTELSPGVYIVGPFGEPKSGAIVSSSQMTVNQGNFSEIKVTFKSQ